MRPLHSVAPKEMKKEKVFTWADLKRAVNKMPENRLKDPVVIWNDDETCYQVTDVEVLNEDYRHDGDEGVIPNSVMKENYDDYKQGIKDGDYNVVYPKGTRIINAAK